MSTEEQQNLDDIRRHWEDFGIADGINCVLQDIEDREWASIDEVRELLMLYKDDLRRWGEQDGTTPPESED